MGLVNMSSNPPATHTKDFFASPALSLTLAGIFRHAGGSGREPGSMEVEEGDEESGGGYGGGKSHHNHQQEDMLEISSENTGPCRTDDDVDMGMDRLNDEEGDEEDNNNNNKSKKKRKKYHRHTAEQIKEMEALFKESPHPDEKQRQQLSKKLGLAPRQVKFWFQNRRTQIKAIQERHENSLLKSEMDKLQEENRVMRETIKKSCCPNCGFATTSKDSAALSTEEQQLRIENARLKAEVDKLRSTARKFATGDTSPTSSGSAGNNGQENRSTLDYYTGIFGIDKSRIFDIVNQSMEELIKMATAGEPLWVQSVESGREILNYDEYKREFSPESSSTSARVRRSIEVSREAGVVFVDLPRLIQAFMDVNQWKEMFPSLISKAATVDVISNGEGANKNGAAQLMFAEFQMLTPLVPTREVYFIRYCKQLSPERWAIVDVSIDNVEDTIDASLVKCRKRPSGCIIEDKANGHCKVMWIEHLETQKTMIHSLFRSTVNSGVAFGAKRWMSTLQLQCERLVFGMATNVPTKDSSGVATLAGRKSILKLAQRMTSSFCRGIGASSHNTWTKIVTKAGDDIRIASRKNLNDPGEPLGVIVCAVSSTWVPVAPSVLFDFLRDDARRMEWDIMSMGGPVQSIANLAKGQDRGNTVTIQASKSKDSSTWILQDCCTNGFESMIVYASVDIPELQSAMTGCDSSKVAILPSGFSILSDGLETRPLVISSRQEEKTVEGAGSLFTMVFQILANSTPAAKLTMESLETVNTLVACTLQNIKKGLDCED
ncbi:hypothetical protein MKW98_010587 [Papaver atlanticum]|uniref:Uncharacterized protein n=1 Tax=Papaver atlanticum TaxID=357466 RepID=A0AAD4S463_9MAGN|nr:hypothetical protein MKW98_010587 [Papaver atlanticum]